MARFDDGEKDFRLSGRSFRKRRQEFIDAVRGQQPKPLQTWALDVNGSLYPPKQVVALTTGFNDFTSHQANAVLRRFGFEPFTIGGEGPHLPVLPVDSSVSESTEGCRQIPDVRLTALREAISFIAQRPDSSPDDVLDAAEKFELWLNRR